MLVGKVLVIYLKLKSNNMKLLHLLVFLFLVNSVNSYINDYPLRTSSLPRSSTATYQSDPVAIFNSGQLKPEEHAQLLSVHLYFNFIMNFNPGYYNPFNDIGNFDGCA